MTKLSLDSDVPQKDRTYSALRVPVAAGVFFLWAGYIFIGVRDIPEFSGYLQTLVAALAFLGLSRLRGSAFKDCAWVLPLVLVLACGLGGFGGKRSAPKAVEFTPRLSETPLAVNGIGLGMTRDEVNQKLGPPETNESLLAKYGDILVEFRGEKVVAIDGSVLEQDAQSVLQTGQDRIALTHVFTPGSSDPHPKLRYQHGQDVVRFNLSQKKISQIILYRSGILELQLKPKEMTIESP